ncbi:hypothetical protein BGX21_001092, partial [Mortierella sp. AD011]
MDLTPVFKLKLPNHWGYHSHQVAWTVALKANSSTHRLKYSDEGLKLCIDYAHFSSK